MVSRVVRLRPGPCHGRGDRINHRMVNEIEVDSYGASVARALGELRGTGVQRQDPVSLKPFLARGPDRGVLGV